MIDWLQQGLREGEIKGNPQVSGSAAEWVMLAGETGGACLEGEYTDREDMVSWG